MASRGTNTLNWTLGIVLLLLVGAQSQSKSVGQGRDYLDIVGCIIFSLNEQ